MYEYPLLDEKKSIPMRPHTSSCSFQPLPTSPEVGFHLPVHGFLGIIWAEVVALCLDSSPLTTAASRITPRSLSELPLPSQKIFDKIKNIELI